MATISTQTENDITTLYRFRDVAEDTCSADAVTDALMSQIEERDTKIKRLEGVLEGFYKVGEYVQQRHQAYGYEEPPGNPDALRERLGDVFDEYEELERDKDEAEDQAYDMEYDKDNLQEQYDELEEKADRWKEERDEAQKKCEEIKTSLDTSINYWKSKAENDAGASQAVISMLKDENEVNKKNMFKFMKENKELREEVEGFHSICDEYLEGTETTRNPEFLGSYIEEKDEEIAALVEELNDIKDNVFPGYDDDITELKKENKELREKIKTMLCQ